MPTSPAKDPQITSENTGLQTSILKDGNKGEIDQASGSAQKKDDKMPESDDIDLKDNEQNTDSAKTPQEAPKQEVQQQKFSVSLSEQQTRLAQLQIVKTNEQILQLREGLYYQFLEKQNLSLVNKKGKEMGYSESNKMTVKKFTNRPSGLVMPMSHFTGQNVWILKPTGFNRGKGIHVINSLSKLKKLIKEYSRSKEAGASSQVNPMQSQT